MIPVVRRLCIIIIERILAVQALRSFPFAVGLPSTNLTSNQAGLLPTRQPHLNDQLTITEQCHRSQARMAAANLASTLATRAAASSSLVQAATTTTTTADSALTEADSSDIQGGSGRRQLRSGTLKRKRSLEVINDIAGTASGPSLGRHSKHASTSVDEVSLQTSFADKSNGRLTRCVRQSIIYSRPNLRQTSAEHALHPCCCRPKAV